MSRSIDEIRAELRGISRKGDHEQDLVAELARAIESEAQISPSVPEVPGAYENVLQEGIPLDLVNPPHEPFAK